MSYQNFNPGTIPFKLFTIDGREVHIQSCDIEYNNGRYALSGMYAQVRVSAMIPIDDLHPPQTEEMKRANAREAGRHALPTTPLALPPPTRNEPA